MKSIAIAAALFLSITAISQNHVYLYPSIGFSKYTNANAQPQAMLSAGVTSGIASVGVGSGWTKFAGNSTPYIPYFAELLVTPSKGNLGPFISARLGSAIYDNKTSYATTHAGLFMEFKVGLAGGKRSKFIFSGGYTNSHFKTMSPIGQDGNMANKVDGISVSMGVKI
jgi:hypothetical protein